MTDAIEYSARMAVVDGPTVETPALSSTFEAEAWEKIEFTIEKDSGPTSVILQPSPLEQVKGLIILSDVYADLTFTVDVEVTEHVLDGPLMLIGPGNVSLLGGVAQTLNILKFTNASLLLDANLTVLVARTAIEPQT